MPKSPLSPGPMSPMQDLGRPVVLVNTKGLTKTVYQVVGIEYIPNLSAPRGFLPLYLPTNAVLAGYTKLGGEASGPLASGGQTSTISPTALNLNPGALFQNRMLLRVVGTLPASVAVDDFDLTFSNPPATAHWQLQNQGGVVNAAFQFPLPADATLGSTQGADQLLPAAYPALINPFDAAYMTENFIWGQQPPTFVITNNSSVLVPSTQAMMIGINMSGIRYDLDVWPSSLADQSTRKFAIGSTEIMAPPDTVMVPIAAFAPTSRTATS